VEAVHASCGLHEWGPIFGCRSGAVAVVGTRGLLGLFWTSGTATRGVASLFATSGTRTLGFSLFVTLGTGTRGFVGRFGTTGISRGS
jgi:hypothetical protein